jgi:hypothetical protein
MNHIEDLQKELQLQTAAINKMTVCLETLTVQFTYQQASLDRLWKIVWGVISFTFVAVGCALTALVVK